MADNWKEKYDKLLTNFKNLDKQNDVLYRCYIAARRMRNNGFSNDFLKELYDCVSQVENFENELKNNIDP